MLKLDDCGDMLDRMLNTLPSLIAERKRAMKYGLQMNEDMTRRCQEYCERMAQIGRVFQGGKASQMPTPETARKVLDFSPMDHTTSYNHGFPSASDPANECTFFDNSLQSDSRSDDIDDELEEEGQETIQSNQGFRSKLI